MRRVACGALVSSYDLELSNVAVLSPISQSCATRAPKVLKIFAVLRALKNCRVAQTIMISGEPSAMHMTNKRRKVIETFLSLIPGMFGWIAVHVHANKVTTQLKTMPHNVLGLLLDEESLALRMGTVLLTFGIEARTDRMYNRRAHGGMKVMVSEVESVRPLLSLRTWQHVSWRDSPGLSPHASRLPLSPPGRECIMKGLNVQGLGCKLHVNMRQIVWHSSHLPTAASEQMCKEHDDTFLCLL